MIRTVSASSFAIGDEKATEPYNRHLNFNLTQQQQESHRTRWPPKQKQNQSVKTIARVSCPRDAIVAARAINIIGEDEDVSSYYLRWEQESHRTRWPPKQKQNQSVKTVARASSPRDAIVAARAINIIGEDEDVSSYYLGWEEAQTNAYDEHKNPRGCIQLGLSENKLSLDLLETWFSTHDTGLVPELENILSFKAISGYPDVYHGLSIFRSLLASFMDEVFEGRVGFNADQMVVTTGATAAIEILAFCLADPGDVFLVPGPYYPGFDRDITFRTQVSLLPVQSSSENDFLLTRRALEQAYDDTQKSGRTVRALLMTSPSNPLGITYDENHLLMILNFVKDNDLHLICDEIYAGSAFGSRFVSMAELGASPPFDSSRLHIVFGISKILGLPGFRVGLLYSWNQQLLEASKKLTRFSSVSTQTQGHLVPLLSDHKFLKFYLTENRRRLAKRWAVVRHGLHESGLRATECVSGFYCWVDMRNLLTVESREEELCLWKQLLYEVGVNITPGSACHCKEPGWFRLCFAFVDDHTMVIALDRLRKFSASIEPEKGKQVKACGRQVES